MFNLIRQLLDWLYHENCYFCHKQAKFGLICQKCYEEINISFPDPVKEVCGVKIFSATKYENNIKKLIRGLKYHDKKKLAEPMAKLMYTFWKELEISKEEFELVPMPLFSERQKQRGYNHVKLIADEFSKLTGYPVNIDIVKRIKNTKPQYKLSAVERMKNLKDAFKIDINHYNGKNILIMDDICTSGATVKEMITAFNNNNIHNISVIVGANPI